MSVVGQQAPELIKLPHVPTKSATADAPPFLRGIVFEGTNKFAAISETRMSKIGWYKQSESVSGFLVKAIDVDSVTLVNSQTKKESTIYLEKAVVGSSTDSGGLQPFSAAWINSSENPMVHSIHPLPIEVQKKWVSLSKEEKQAIIDLYLKYGWRLLSAEVVGGSVTLAWENIYQEERREKLNQRREEFAAMLSPEQAEQYRKIRSAQPMYATNGQLTLEQQNEAAERRRNFASFQNSLNASQSATFAGTTDITKGKW